MSQGHLLDLALENDEGKQKMNDEQEQKTEVVEAGGEESDGK